MSKYEEKNYCYADMSNGGKEGGQSITKIDNSIHSEIWDEPMQNGYERSRKGYNANGLDQSGMKGAK